MTQNDGNSEGLIGVLEAVQRLVQELTVLLSSIDQGNMTQLPQQVMHSSINVDRRPMLGWHRYAQRCAQMQKLPNSVIMLL